MTTAATHCYFRTSVLVEDEYEYAISTLKSTVHFNEICCMRRPPKMIDRNKKVKFGGWGGFSGPVPNLLGERLSTPAAVRFKHLLNL